MSVAARALTIQRGDIAIEAAEVERTLRLACTDGNDLSGIVRELIAFSVPHEALGEALGIAAVCVPGRTVSLGQLRFAARRQPWSPDMLLLLKALPYEPDGQPASLGLAEALQLPKLTIKQPTRTVDLRASSSLDGTPDYESAQRAAARKAASLRRAARRKPKDGASFMSATSAAAASRNAPTASSGATSVRALIELVAETMSEVGGENVNEEDDLFQVGLSSVTAARLRLALAERLQIDIPPDLVYRFTAVTSLAAVLFQLRGGQRLEGAAVLWLRRSTNDVRMCARHIRK